MAHVRRWAVMSLLGCLMLAAAEGMTFEAEDAPVHTAGMAIEGGWNLHSNGEVGAYVKMPQQAVYTVIVRAAGTPCRGV